jgi:hypothetical protein
MENKLQWIPDFCQNVNADPKFDGGLACAEGRIVNRVIGFVQSHHVGLVRAGVRIKILERTDLRVKWPVENERIIRVGQRVVATIPAEAVWLEAGMFRRSKQRWNRWIGRIVLMESGDTGTVFTVKIHGEAWTLKAYGPVVGARQPSKSWDAVNVVVDPQMVDLWIVDRKPWYQGIDHMSGL